MSRVLVYNRFWSTRGGGEKMSGALAALIAEDDRHEVELLGPEPVELDALAAHLGIDLSRVRLRVVPDLVDGALPELTADYDLFVNATYMSRATGAARRNVYLCYFPTPADFAVPAWRRPLQRRLAAGLGRAALVRRPEFGTGWYPPEGGLRRQWRWTNGAADLVAETGPGEVVAFDLGSPGAPGPTTLTVSEPRGEVHAELPVLEGFQRVRLALPPGRHRLHLASGSRVPAGADNRRLGVAASRIAIESARPGLREQLAQRLPAATSAGDTAFTETYDAVLAISDYTAHWVRTYWSVEPRLLTPPVAVAEAQPAERREPAIVSVGRFFAKEHGHSKRQLEMVQAFGAAWRAGTLPRETSFSVVGGCAPEHEPYLREVQAAAQGLPVQVLANAGRDVVRSLLGSAAVFWHATGLGEGAGSPWAQEHFGITTVEAMAAGCVPVVIDQAGQREIVREGVDGYRWSTVDELVARTAQVLGDEALRARLAGSARERAQTYGEAAFAARWGELDRELDLLPG